MTFVLIVLVVKGILPGWEDERTDFNNYYAASKLLMAGDTLSTFYNNQSFSEKSSELGITGGAKFAPFPPPTAVFYAPLTFLDYLTAKRLWLVFNLLLLVLLPFRLRYHFKVPLEQSVLFISILVIPLASNINFGQAYLLMAFALVEIVGLMRQSNNPILTGFVLGLLTVLKYFPILFLAYTGKHFKGMIKTSIIVLLTVLVISLVFAFMDTATYPAYFSVLTDHVQGDLSGQGKYAITFQSLDSLFNNLFVFDSKLNPDPLIDMPVLKSIFKGIFVFIVGGMCSYLIIKDRFRFNWIDVSIGIFGLFILVPASASYHFLLFVVPLVIVGKWLFKEKSAQSVWFVWIMLFLAVSIQFHYIPEFKSFPTLNVIIHYPRLWLFLAVFVSLFVLRIKEKWFEGDREPNMVN